MQLISRPLGCQVRARFGQGGRCHRTRLSGRVELSLPLTCL